MYSFQRANNLLFKISMPVVTFCAISNAAVARPIETEQKSRQSGQSQESSQPSVLEALKELLIGSDRISEGESVNGQTNCNICDIAPE